VNSGYLRLTNNTGNNAKAATVPGIFPASGNYISVEFQQYAYNGTGADGIAVTLSDYATSAVPGAFGGSLGYAQKTGTSCSSTAGVTCPGFAGGWIGVALDEFGNYQNPTEGRIGGPGVVSQSVGVRGSGSGVNGYNWLAGTSSLTPQIDNHTSTTPSPGYYYQVIVDARNDASGTTSVSVNRDTGGGYSPLISIPNVYTAAAAQGFTQSAVPSNWQISFTGSTGGSTNIHEISGLRICAQTIAPPSGGTASGFNAIDEAYGTPPSVAVQNYLTGHIYTKLVGTPFKLNVAAISNSQILTTYAASSAKSVTLKLVDNTDGACVLDSAQANYCSSTCTSKSAVTGGSQTLTFASGASDKGQKQSASFTLNTAYKNLVAIMSDGTTTACSTDAFSVRPTGITSVTSTAASNNGTATVKVDTGNFDMTALVAGVTNSPGGYTGTLKINSTQVKPVSPISSGTLAPLYFPAATSNTSNSTATGTTFSYSALGTFNISGYDPATDTSSMRGVYDGVTTSVDCPSPTTTTQCDTYRAATWTGVDSISSKGDCILDSYSNTKDSTGKYGCNFGNVSTVTLGRFIPEHFNTVVTGPVGCPSGLTCPGSNFAYSGQAFTTTVTARSGSDAIMTDYDSSKGFSRAVTLSAWDAAGSTATSNPNGGTLSGNTVVSTAFSAGSATVSTPIYTLPVAYPSLSPTAPTDIYMRANDTDGVTSLRTSAVEGGIKIANGRILVHNAYGSELLPLTVYAVVQYWNGSQSVTNTNDSSTSFQPSNVNLSNCTKNLAGSPCKSTVAVYTSPSTITASGGSVMFKMKAPGADGSVDLKVNSPAYLPSTTGRATFGVYKAGPVIYLREVY
jgi:MSHA biogenesis protein MshQ